LRVRLREIAVFIAVGMVSNQAPAYRPFESTDAGVVSQGTLEIELGALTVEHNEGKTGYIVPSLVFNHGLTDVLELVGEFELENPPDSSWAIADPGLFLKALLKEGVLQDHSGLSIAVEFGVLLPSSGDGENDIGGEAILIASGSVASFTYHINFGGGVDRTGNAFWSWGLIGEAPVSNELTLAGEIVREDVAGAGPDHSILVGALFQPEGSGVVFDLGVRRGLISDSLDWSATIGLTFSF